MGQHTRFEHGDLVMVIDYATNGHNGVSIKAKFGVVQEVRTYRAEKRDPQYNLSLKWWLSSKASEGWEPRTKEMHETGGPYGESELCAVPIDVKNAFDLYERVLDEADRCAFQLSEALKRRVEHDRNVTFLE